MRSNFYCLVGVSSLQLASCSIVLMELSTYCMSDIGLSSQWCWTFTNTSFSSILLSFHPFLISYFFHLSLLFPSQCRHEVCNAVFLKNGCWEVLKHLACMLKERNYLRSAENCCKVTALLGHLYASVFTAALLHSCVALWKRLLYHAQIGRRESRIANELKFILSVKLLTTARYLKKTARCEVTWFLLFVRYFGVIKSRRIRMGKWEMYRQFWLEILWINNRLRRT